MTEEAIVCTLSEREQGQRAAELEGRLFAMVEEVREIDGGMALRFPATAEARTEVDAFIEFEKQCCRFLDFAVVDRTDGLWLELAGPEGTLDFLRSWIPQATDATAPASAWMRRAGWAGISASVFALVCCATPLLSMALVALGVTASAAVMGWVDGVAGLVLLASIGLLLIARSRRPQPAAGDCGCS